MEAGLGFISLLFVGRSVQGEGEGIKAFGTGIEGFHLDPGKTLTIHLTPDQQGKITFRCDLHPEVEGELYLLDVPVGAWLCTNGEVIHNWSITAGFASERLLWKRGAELPM